MAKYNKPYTESIYAEMLEGQRAKENAILLEKEKIILHQQKAKEEEQKFVLNEVER